MTTQELKEYIGRVLGNSIRCLLPSYWWKRVFGLVVDKVDEVDNKVEDLKNKSDYITFYLTSDPNSEWAKKNYDSYYKITQTLGVGKIYPIFIQTSHDEYWSELFMDLYVTGGIEYNLFMLTLPKVSFGRNTCNIHLIPFENTVTCEIERLTFIDESLIPTDTWATIKQKELYKEIEDVSESIPVYYMVDYQASITAITTPYTINESEPMYIYGFVGNSEIVDGKIENVELSSLTISGPMPPNYTLKIGWYDNEGKFNKSDVIYNLTRTKICSSEISVDPNKEYIIASETNSFGIEIFEYDEQLNFIQKTYKSIHTNKPILASNTITFTENTKYITFNLYNYGNDLTQADIVFLDASQSYDKTRIHYGVSGTHNLSGQLRGLPEVQDTRIGSVLTRRVGVRDYKEGDVNSGYMLTDGTTTLYALNPEEYKIETVIPYGIAFYGTALGCTISSNIPMGVYGWSTGSALQLQVMGSSAKSYDAVVYSEMFNKQDPLISGTNIKTINGESILGSGNIEVSSEGPSYDDTELRNQLNAKQDKVEGKQLSTEDFTTALKTKLEGMSSFDPTEINNKVDGLQSQLDTLVSGDASTAIESFNEIIAFLNGVQDSESLDGIIAGIEQQIAGKMDKVTLATVATSGSYNDLSNKPTIPAAVTESTVSGWGFTKNTGTYSKPSTGIPKADLAGDVQTSLGKADTALQEHQDISHLATKEEVASLSNEVVANEEVTAAALNDLNERIKGVDYLISRTTVTKKELQESIQSITDEMVVNEEVTAMALVDLNDKILAHDALLSDAYVTKNELHKSSDDLINIVITNEEVTAAALTDLNTRITELQHVMENIINTINIIKQ